MMRVVKTAALLATTNVAAQSCQEYANYYYCSAVDTIVYTNVGGSGVYNKVASMDESTGVCSSSPYQYSGDLAPFDEEVVSEFSMRFSI